MNIIQLHGETQDEGASRLFSDNKLRGNAMSIPRS